jgi:hypothetical protein
LYPVVVRWRERYEFPEYCSKILTWRELAEEINRQKPAKLKWLNKKHFANGKEPAVFPAVMGLSFLAERELFDLVQHGAPFIVWPRREPRDGFPRLRSRIDAWAQAHETTVQLRRRLIVLRKSHLDAHNGVAVFWDEPTRRYPFKYEDVQFAQEDTLA